MKIIKTTPYQRDFRKKIQGKNLIKEETIKAIEELMMNSNNMKELLLNPLSIIHYL